MASASASLQVRGSASRARSALMASSRARFSGLETASRYSGRCSGVWPSVKTRSRSVLGGEFAQKAFVVRVGRVELARLVTQQRRGTRHVGAVGAALVEIERHLVGLELRRQRLRLSGRANSASRQQRLRRHERCSRIKSEPMRRP